MDSFMFQTVGYNVVCAISESLGVPLVQHTTQGLAKNQSLEYSPEDNDEVEDLFLLLQQVKVRLLL